MRVLADHHHAALFHSLYMLFEERLGWELYRQIGPEWYPDYWYIYDHPHTVNQFLGTHQGTEIPLDVWGKPLPEQERKNLHYTVEDGIYYVRDVSHGATHRAITLDKFKEMDFDIVISSVPQHIGRFNKLVAKHQPKAKHIFQVGNAWTHLPGVNNIMASTAPFPVAPGINLVNYHQEFDLSHFKYEPPEFHNVVHSYVHYMKETHIMDSVASSPSLPGWTWRKFGAGMPQSIQDSRGVGDAMRASGWTWHYKPEGDGYGHTIFSSYACGRPAIVWGNFYQGKLASELFMDQKTCIDASRYPNTQLATLIKRFSEPDRHKRMCADAYTRFREVVDFDAEAEMLKRFLENLR